MAISSSARSVMSTASVTALRMRRSSPGRVHTSPHAQRVMKSWKSAVKSVVRACARSTCSSPRTARRTSMPSSWRSWSDREEGRLMGPLEVDVELVAVGAGLGDEGRACVLVEARQHRIGGVGLSLVGEVHARDDLVQQPAGEDVEVDVGRLRGLAGGARDRPRLEGEDGPAPLVVGARAPEAAKVAAEA